MRPRPLASLQLSVAPPPVGAATTAWYQFAPDECLIFSVRLFDAPYLGCQVTDPWGVSWESVERSGSLNNHQVRPNADGTITYVIAATDPGVHNWLDAGGHGLGMVALRWQGLSPDTDMTDAVFDCRVVPLADLLDVVGAEQAVSPAERTDLLAERAGAHANRRR